MTHKKLYIIFHSVISNEFPIINNHSLKRYCKLIEYYKNRNWKKKKNDGLEKHHIIPRSLGGADNSNNLVVVSIREHFILHRILALAFNGPMKKALNCMLNLNKISAENKISSREFEKIRLEVHKIQSEQNSGKKNPNFGKRGEQASHFGKPHSAEARKKISDSNKGKKISAEARKKISDSKRGEKNPHFGKGGEQANNFGKIWICHSEKKSKMIHSEEFPEYSSQGFVLGKKFACRN